MKKFKDIIFENNIVIHCPEKWMADELLKYADSKGYGWIDGDKYEKSFWEEYGENTCYSIYYGQYDHICSSNFKNETILHYNDVAIKEEGENNMNKVSIELNRIINEMIEPLKEISFLGVENQKNESNMETKLDYELWIKGRKAEIGERLLIKYCNDYFNAQISRIFFERGYFHVRYYNIDEDKFGVTKNLDNFFWEKPIIYQLPDTEGNLSEVKIGQPVWRKIDNDVLEEYEIISCKDTCIGLINKRTERHDSVITGIGELLIAGGVVTTNKPKRDFSPYFDFNQAPNGYNFGVVTENGYAFWFKHKPEIVVNDWDCNGKWLSAGFRQNLINPETCCVDDWKDSLVDRPKEE